MKRIYIIIALMFVTFAVKAQRFHDAKAFGLNGHVKECIIIEGDDDLFGFKQIEFDREGRLTFYDYDGVSNAKRSPDGYLTSFSVYGDYVIKYDNSHKVSEYTSHKITDRYTYNNNGRPVKVTLICDDIRLNGAWSNIETSAYDKHNNFVECKTVTCTGYTNSFKRIITYWEDSTSPDNYNLWNLSDIAFFSTVKVQKVMPIVTTYTKNNVPMKRRLVFVAPKGTTSNEITDWYIVSFNQKDEFKSHIPTKVCGLAYHDLGSDKEYLGIDVKYTRYKYNTTQIAEVKNYELKIEGESDAQYLLDTNTDDTGWKMVNMLNFRITKDVNTRQSSDQ